MRGSSFGVSYYSRGGEAARMSGGCGPGTIDFLLLEEFVEGVEVTVSVWLGRPMTVIEIHPRSGFFDHKNKYTKGCTDYHLPARLAPNLLSRCQEIAVKTCEVCRVRTYSRVDFMISQSDQPYVLEINTLPGFTPTSLLPMSAAYEKIPFVQLVETLVEKAGLDYASLK